MPSSARLPKLLWLILAVALALRLVGAWRAHLMFDERAHLALADTISFSPGQVHLVSRTLDHPLLSIYVLKLSGMLFGTTDFGLRLLHVVAGTLTVLVVFHLGRMVFSESVGLWAAGLLAVDQFHATWSRVFMPEVLLLLFTATTLWLFRRLLDRATTGDFVLLGGSMGLAYLAKEPGLLLPVILWLAVLLTPSSRWLLRRPGWYLAHGVLLLVIAPDLIWNLAQFHESYLYRDLALISRAPVVQMKSMSLYVGELFRWWIHPDVLDVEYEQGAVFACHWPAGLIYLGGVVGALTQWRRPPARLMLVAWALVFIVFTFLPGGERFDPFWWASMSLVPAVVCGAWLLETIRRWHIAGGIFGVALVVYLAATLVSTMVRSGPEEPRATVEQIATDFLRAGQAELEAGNLDAAQARFIYVLNLAGGRPEAYRGLAEIAQRRGQPNAAEDLLRKAARPVP